MNGPSVISRSDSSNLQCECRLISPLFPRDQVVVVFIRLGKAAKQPTPAPPMGHIGRVTIELFYTIDTGWPPGTHCNLSSESCPKARCFWEQFKLCPPHGRLEGSVSGQCAVSSLNCGAWTRAVGITIWSFMGSEGSSAYAQLGIKWHIGMKNIGFMDLRFSQYDRVMERLCKIHDIKNCYFTYHTQI